MRQRVISAIFFVIVMLGGIFGGGTLFFLLFLFITGGSLWEFAGLVFNEERNYFRLRRVITTLLGLLPFLFIGLRAMTGVMMADDVIRLWSFPTGSSYWILDVGALLLFSIFLLLVMELFLESRQPFVNLGYYLTGIVYLGIPFAMLIYIAAGPEGYSPWRVIGLLLLPWTNDTLAYLVGSQIGKTPFFPRISPKKTWEGTLGGMVCTVLVAWLLARWLPAYTLREWIVLAAVVGVFGTLGDLVESMLKRSMGVKDSGSIMPGHGGFLDRFDSFIFVLPFAWLVLMYL
ncbi:MAG: phosphatidate cytidylyltransferase [Saprospiraceae bacterium]